MMHQPGQAATQQPGGGTGQQANPMPGAGAQPRPQQQQQQVRINQDELAAIERLKELGFEEQRVIRAFIMCGRNEEHAANFLFEQGAADDDDALLQGILASQ